MARDSLIPEEDDLETAAPAAPEDASPTPEEEEEEEEEDNSFQHFNSFTRSLKRDAEVIPPEAESFKRSLRSGASLLAENDSADDVASYLEP